VESRTAVAVGKTMQVKGKGTRYHGGWYKLTSSKPLLVVVHTFSQFFFPCLSCKSSHCLFCTVESSQSSAGWQTSVPMLLL